MQKILDAGTLFKTVLNLMNVCMKVCRHRALEIASFLIAVASDQH